MELKQKDTFLNDIESTEIDTMLHEVYLRKMGWKIYYIIDPAEIRDYCFPFGLTANEKDYIVKKKDKQYISDEHLLLRKLFSSTSIDQKIVLKVYHEEIKNLISYCFKHISKVPLDGSKAFDFFFSDEGNSSFNEIISKKPTQINDIDSHSLSTEFVEEHSSEGLAAIYLLQDGLTRMHEVLNKHLILDEVQAINNESIIDAIHLPRLHEMLDENRVTQLLYSTGVDLERSKKRDAHAITSLITANKELLSQKILLLYFSDADSSKRVITQLSGEVPEYPTYPTEDGRLAIMHFVRTRRQLFSLFLCEGFFNNPTESKINEYENITTKLKQLSHLIEEFSLAKKVYKGLHLRDMDFLKKNHVIYNRYTTIRNSLENVGVFFQFSDYLDQAQKIAQKSDKRDAKILIDTLIRDLGKIRKSLKPINESLTLLINEVKFNRLIKDKLINISERKGQFFFNRGLDPVQSMYNRFPLCFLLSTKSNNFTILHELVEVILQRKSDAVDFLPSLEGFIERINVKPYADDEFLIKSFMLLLLPDLNQSESNINNNYRAHKRIEDIFRIRESKLSNDLKEELWYVNVWALRRTKLYDQSLSLAKKTVNHIVGLETSGSTIVRLSRFYHGISLANYCKYIDSRTIHFLQESIDYCKKAHSAYQHLENIELRKKLQECLLNSLCHQYSLHFVAENKLDSIETNIPRSVFASKSLNDARGYLIMLRDSVGRKLFYEYPEYNHTESFLEYYESFVFIDPKKKLMHALEAIKRAIDGSVNDESLKKEYEEFREKIVFRYEALIATESKDSPDP